MRKYYIIILAFLIFFYLVITFILSFTFLSRSVSNNNPISLEKYIHIKKLKNNIYLDFNRFAQSSIDSINKKIDIKDSQIKFEGELTASFLIKIFSKLSVNISEDLSKPRIMLFFYFNSKEIASYLEKSFSNFGEYNFEKYLIDRSLNLPIKEVKITKNILSKSQIIKVEDIKKNKNFNLNISRLFKKFMATNYFFFISPIHFKLSVNHQDIPFVVIFRFNGLIWKVEKIKIPYNELIKFENINLKF